MKRIDVRDKANVGNEIIDFFLAKFPDLNKSILVRSCVYKAYEDFIREDAIGRGKAFVSTLIDIDRQLAEKFEQTRNIGQRQGEPTEQVKQLAKG